MESSRKDDRLSAALEALRPLPAPAFAAELDERAAAGFPRRERSAGTPWASLREWMRTLTPRQVLLPSLATAFVAVVIGTALVATNQPGTSLNTDVSAQQEVQRAPADAGGAVSGLPNLPVEESAEAETASKSEASAGAGAGFAAPEAESAQDLATPNAAPAQAPHRDIERSAKVVLGAAPEDVSGDAAKVFEAVHAAHGIVLSSSIDSGSAGATGAQFELLIPSAKLDDTLGSISGIDDVLLRRDGSTDITAPTVDASERLQDSRARVESLLNELAASETEIERETIEVQLAAERRRAAVLSAQLDALQRRASLAHVSVGIHGDESSAGAGGWDIGDAAGDAGHILSLAAGVTLIGLAVLAPIALIALLFWLGHRAWVGYSRRRALG